MNALTQHASGAIRSRVPYEEYSQLKGVNFSRLKELKRSPRHYQYRLTAAAVSKSLSLGTAAHCAVLEPERFQRQFAVWGRRSESGNLCPRKGQYWDEFVARNPGKTIITEDEGLDALAIAKAVRSESCAMRYLESGEPEVTMQWLLASESLTRKTVTVDCRGRLDWLARIDREHYLIGLKTARDVRGPIFGNAAARYGYAMQWAWYLDGYQAITGVVPKLKEIVVESAPPYDVVVYNVPEDVILQGRADYQALLRVLIDCETRNEWLGWANGTEQDVSLPTWAYDAQDDLSDLELE